MTDSVCTADIRFDTLPGYPFDQRYLEARYSIDRLRSSLSALAGRLGLRHITLMCGDRGEHVPPPALERFVAG